MPTSIIVKSFDWVREREVAFCPGLAYPTPDMKLFPILFYLLVFGLASCERHEWHTDAEEGKAPQSTDTINLFLHDDPKGGHAGGEGKDHGGKPEGDH